MSFIIYLTDPDEPWRAEEGGALELYPLVEGEGGTYRSHCYTVTLHRKKCDDAGGTVTQCYHTDVGPYVLVV